MEEASAQIGTTTLDETATVVLDIEGVAQLADRSSGSPKMMRALSRKLSYRAERWPTIGEEDADEPSKKILIKVNSQLESSKQLLINNKALIPAATSLSGSNHADTADGRSKRLNHFMAINPRNVLFIFATVSSISTLILIYFTLTINGTI